MGAPEIRYAELHCKTNFSFLQGASHAEELAAVAAGLGYASLAVTALGARPTIDQIMASSNSFYTSSDLASTKARFGLPEVDNGALGCASHLAKLVSPMKLREMSLTCRPATRCTSRR